MEQRFYMFRVLSHLMSLCYCPAILKEKSNMSPGYSFPGEADLLTHVWWKGGDQSRLGRLYLCVWLRCLVARTWFPGSLVSAV